MLQPVSIALRAIVFRSAFVVPLLRLLPSSETRRLRLHYYLSEAPLPAPSSSSLSSSFDGTGATSPNDTFKAHLEKRSTELKARAHQIWTDERESWWLQHVGLFRILPRKAAVAPLWLNLRWSAFLDDFEASRPRLAYTSYLLSDLVSSVALVWLSSGLIRDSIRAFMMRAPAQLANRVSFIAGWATSGVGLTAATLHALWIRTVGEIAQLDNEEISSVQKGVRYISKALFWNVRELPTLLGDSCLVFAFWHLGHLGKTFTIGRVAWRLWPVGAYLFSNRGNHRPSYSAAEMREPTPWHKVRAHALSLENCGVENYDEHLKPIIELTKKENISEPLKREAFKIVDRYTMLQFAKVAPDKNGPRAKELKERMSANARTVMDLVLSEDYEAMQSEPLGLWIARNESDPKWGPAAEALKPFAFSNPAQHYVYLQQKGGLWNSLAAFAELLPVTFSIWTADEEILPWGKFSDLATSSEGRAGQAHLTFQRAKNSWPVSPISVDH